MSCQIIQERQRKTIVEYSLNFDIADDGGFSFPCDEYGNVYADIAPEAKHNYQECLKHPEKFIRPAYVYTRSWTYTENAKAQCICGETFELYDEYQGACECPNCGRWYNLFGQELVDPKYWEEDNVEEEPW